MRVLACVVVLAWLLPSAVYAQIDAVDPDARPVSPSTSKKKAPSIYADDDELGPEQPDPSRPGSSPYVDDTTGDSDEPDARPVQKKGPPKKEDPKAPVIVPRVEAPKPVPPTLIIKTMSDGELNAIWQRWREANASRNTQAEALARRELLATKELIGSPDMELWAVGLLRAAQVYADAGDDGAAVEIALSASQLAPDLPATWFLLSKLYLTSDPSGVGRYTDALIRGITAQVADPRYLRPMLANAATIVLAAFIATAVIVVVVLLLRRGRYFLYDFHFFFPRAASRWQTSAIAVLLLSLPIVFRLGVVPVLLVFFAAATLYLSVRERIVAAVLIGSLGLIPLVGAFVVQRTVFAETPAEDLYRIERGGPGTEPLAAQYERRAIEDKAGFAERFVVGRFHLNRGNVDKAVVLLRGALRLNPDDVPARISLAKALLLQGDLENSRGLLEKVKDIAPSVVVLVDLARVHQRRVQVYGESNAGEIGKANAYLVQARQLDPSVPATIEEPTGKEIIGNSFLQTIPLPGSALLALANGDDASQRVRSQLSQILLGDVPSVIAPFYPLILALLLVAFGSMALTLEAARVCNRCGRPVSHRGDPDVSRGSPMCTQCVNVFARKNVVSPSIKVRKQLEVARYESQMDRASTVLGVLWSGMGHVFAGQPVRGAIYGFLFVLAIFGVVLRGGVVRAPFEGVPMVVSLIPLAVLFLVVYPLSLLRLRKKQG